MASSDRIGPASRATTVAGLESVAVGLERPPVRAAARTRRPAARRRAGPPARPATAPPGRRRPRLAGDRRRRGDVADLAEVLGQRQGQQRLEVAPLAVAEADRMSEQVHHLATPAPSPGGGARASSWRSRGTVVRNPASPSTAAASCSARPATAAHRRSAAIRGPGSAGSPGSLTSAPCAAAAATEMRLAISRVGLYSAIAANSPVWRPSAAGSRPRYSRPG